MARADPRWLFAPSFRVNLDTVPWKQTSLLVAEKRDDLDSETSEDLCFQMD